MKHRMSLRRVVAWIRWELGGAKSEMPKPIPAPLAKANPFLEPPRVYNKREVVLPSGRFASLSVIRVDDVMVTEDRIALMRMVKLASRVIAIDGEPLTLHQALFMEASEFVPILRMLEAELRGADALSRGIA